MAILDVASSPHGGRVRLLPDSARAPLSIPRLLIFHSIVGTAEGAYRYFHDQTRLESTFIVTLGGQIWQLMDTIREADANYRANPFAISVESEDRGNPDIQPWTDEQLDAFEWLARECHRIHGIPLRRALQWDGSGQGYHTMFGAPSPWTPVAKTCPGKIRIRQFNEVLLPRLAQEDEDMATQAEIEAAVSAALTKTLKPMLDAFSAAGLVFLRNTDALPGDPLDGIFTIVPPGQLLHVEDPSHFYVISGGEGITESVFDLPGTAPVWQLPLNRKPVA